MDWLNFKMTVGFITAVISGAVGAVLGGFDVFLKALVVIVVLDYVSGFLTAYVQKKLSSSIGYRGVAKKVFIFVLVGTAYTVGNLMGTDLLRQVVIGFYIGIEGLSICENACKAGLPVPKLLKNALEEIQKRGEGTKEAR